MDSREHPPAGENLGGYEILELAGQGGMGRVYRARDPGLRRQVALKVLLPEKVDDSRHRQRLLREARAYSALDHRGVVSVYAVGRDRGLDFIAMEWVDGRPLADLIGEEGLPIDQALDVALQLAEALAAVHAAKILHRDLKPQNVMLDELGRVKLLDFSIAKLDEAPDEATWSGTRDGTTPGTMAYMSPEQALAEPLDQRSDIFSFGVVLYEMLTGSQPFQGETVGARIRRLIFADPEPPGRLRAEVPRRLEVVVLRALAKKPELRYPDVETLASELRQCLPRQPGLPNQPSRRGEEPPAVSASTPRRRPLPLLLLGVAVALALTFVYPLISSKLRAPPTAVSEPSVPLPRTPYQLYEEGMHHLERYDREGYVEAAIERFESAVELDPEYAPAWNGLAVAQWRQYRAKRDPVWLQHAAQNARRALELDPLLTDPAVTLARIRVMEGELDAAREELERLRELDPGNADALAGIAEVAFRRDDFEKAAELLGRAIELRPESWELHAELGRYQLSAGKLEASEAAFRESLELVSDNAFARRNLGAVLHYQGRYAEAVAELQGSITIRPTAAAYTNLGTVYYFQGLYREAAEALEAALELGANYYVFWSNLGDAYRQIPGREEDAIACFERAIQLLKPRMAAGAETPTRRSRLALYLVKAGQLPSALEEIAKLEPLGEKSAEVAYRATLVYELAGERSSALRALRTALEGGYPVVEILQEPELMRLREDVAFHELMLPFDAPPFE